MTKAKGFIEFLARSQCRCSDADLQGVRAPGNAPVIIENVVTDIDTIVKQVSFRGWG